MNYSISLQDLVHKNENRYYWLVLIISILTYISLALSIVGILILLGLMFISFFLNALMIGNIRANAVKLSTKQFPDVFRKAEELCERMDIAKVPDIYVLQSEGMLNAFATRFFGRNMIVIYAEIFELITTDHEDELNFVLAHELAHIKRNHLVKQLFILPAMWIPGIAEIYLRACEYTCDRYAAYYTENSEAAKNSLTMLAIGKHLNLHVNKEEYLKQFNDETSFFVWLSEVLSTHPPLPKRINEVDLLFGETTQCLIKLNKFKKRWIFGILSLVVVPITMFVVGIYYGVNQIDVFGPIDEYEYGYEEEDYEEVEISPLIIAIANGDINQVNELIEEGEDIYQEDYYGNTSLDWAVKSGNVEMVELLLDSGADPNYESSYGMTALMTAAETADPTMVKLLIESGANPNYQEYSGTTALHYAIYSSDVQTVQQLLDVGADPSITDSDNMNAYMIAIQSGEREIAELLKKYKE